MASRGQLRVLRIYHAGRVAAYRERERLLGDNAVEVTLVVPSHWPEGGGERNLSPEPFRIVEIPVKRTADVNRHVYADPDSLRALLRETRPDILDLHEEPFSLVARQILSLAPDTLPVVAYTAQNVDKRFPPPFAQYERAAYRRAAALYPCSRQAASVARGKGFEGLIEVLPLGYDPALFFPGRQSPADDEIVLALFGRLVPEKGLTDAVRVLARLNRIRPARLVVHGTGPDEAAGRALAASLGVSERLELSGWKPAAELGDSYRRAHVVLVPSRPTDTWAEQFGRVIVEAQASGAIVAGYDSGTIREVGGQAAVLAPIGDEATLADGIVSTVSAPEVFQRLRGLGLEAAAARRWGCVAAAHAQLYRSVVAGTHRLPQRSSPRLRRDSARSEFGPTAATTAGARPFAIPLLRRPGRTQRALAWFLDAGSELAARVR